MDDSQRGKVKRRDVLLGAGAMATSFALPLSAATPASRPNIVVILADDLGFADLSCYGSRHILTPNLDQLARTGVRFTDAYANSPVCSPTRLAMVTGRYHLRFPTGLVEPFRPGPLGESAVPADYPTLPRVLKRAGYATSLIGKWHLGPTDAGHPLSHGYDHFFGILGGGADYFTHEYDGSPALREDRREITRQGYLTDLLAEEAIGYVRRQARARRPFLLSLHFNAPHWPWEGPGDDGTGTHGNHFDGGSLEIYRAMVENMDWNIGRLMAELRALGLDDDTLILFTSDNGGERFSESWPFRGMKGSLLEGGIRVPQIIRFPHGHAARTVSAVPTLTMDVMPTILAAAGIAEADRPEMDGVDLRGLLGSPAALERPLFWRFQGHRQRAARSGRWKYYRMGENEFLFDLAVDSLERADRAEAEPQVLAQIKAAWDQWNSGMANEEALGFCFSPETMAGELPQTEAENCRLPSRRE